MGSSFKIYDDNLNSFIGWSSNPPDFITKIGKAPDMFVEIYLDINDDNIA